MAAEDCAGLNIVWQEHLGRKMNSQLKFAQTYTNSFHLLEAKNRME